MATRGVAQRPARRGVPRAHTVKSVPPPVGGLNYAAAINGMAPEDAIALDNWICTRFGLSIRGGWYEHASTLVAPVRSLLPWVGATGTGDKLFAATDAGIYDVTTGGAGPWTAVFNLSAEVGAGTLQSLNFSAAGRNYLICCSEKDGYHRYDTTDGWVKVASGGGAGQLAGVDPDALVQACAWKRRLWFVERDSASIWYLPVLAVAGTAVEFDVGPQLSKGGHVVAVVNWTMDAGEGMDDHLVILGSEGDVVIYKGTDPSDATKFGLVGVWEVGRLPSGRRCVSQNGGDVLIVSSYGLSPLSTLVKGGKTATEVDPRNFVSRIQEVLRKDVQTLTGDGWEITAYESEALLLINCPATTDARNKQYALDTHSLRWSTFSGIPAIAFAEFGGALYFGTEDGQVCVALSGELDRVLISGGTAAATYIQATMLSAFNYFESPGQLKRWLMVRPTFVAPKKPGVAVRMNGDFDSTLPAGIPGFAGFSAYKWDTAKWDTAKWGGKVRTYQPWLGAEGTGYAGSLGMTVVGAGGTRLSSIDFMIEAGGPL